MPLAIAPTEKILTITKILVDSKTKKHLENLGLTINTKLEVICQCSGNTILIVKNVRLALDSNIATKIFVA